MTPLEVHCSTPLANAAIATVGNKQNILANTVAGEKGDGSATNEEKGDDDEDDGPADGDKDISGGVHSSANETAIDRLQQERTAHNSTENDAEIAAGEQASYEKGASYDLKLPAVNDTRKLPAKRNNGE